MKERQEEPFLEPSRGRRTTQTKDQIREEAGRGDWTGFEERALWCG